MKRLFTFMLLLLAALTGSAWGAHVGRTVVRPLPLTIDRPDMVLLTIGDSQTAGRYPVPPSGTAEIASDSSIAVSTTIPFVYPNRFGERLGMADTARFVNYLDPFASTLKPTERMLSKVRYYAQSHDWTARLAHLLGTNYWYSIAWDGTGLTDCWGTGAAANDYDVAGENWGWDNVAAASADIIVIKLGINDANTGQCDTAQNILSTYPVLIDKLYEINPDVKILLLGIHPFGGSSSHGSSATIARADSLESWIVGRAPYYNDSTGAKQSALGRYAAQVARGQFSTYSYAYRFVNYNTAGADTAISACTDTTLTRFHDGAYLHFSWRGEQLHAQHMARDVFGAELPDGADTTDVGDWPTPLFTREAKTVYCDTATGDNYGNWLDPFSATRPMATLNGAIWRAGPGATVEFAEGDYGVSWWTMAGGQYFRPAVYQSGESDRIILDGNGVATARVDGDCTSGFSLAPATTSMPDSLHRFYYTFRNWRFVGNNAITLFTMANTTGLRFEDCEFDSTDTIYRSAESGTPAITTPLTLAFDGCTFDGWGRGAGQSGIYPSGSTNYQFHIDFTNNVVQDVGVAGATAHGRGLFRITSADTPTTSSRRLNFVGNDIHAVDLNTARIMEVQDCDLFFANNKIRLGWGCNSATQQVFTAGTTTGGGDTLWFVNNILTFDTTRTITDIGTWPSDAEWYDRNYYKNTITLTATAGNRGTAFVPSAMTADNDTIRFGGRNLAQKTGWPAHYVSTYWDEAMGPNHASIGPVQYTESPFISIRSVAGRSEYARFVGHWPILRLINNGVLPASQDSIADKNDWYQIAKPTTPSDQAQYRLWMDEYFKLTKTAQKIIWKVDGVSSGMNAWYGHYRWLDSLTNHGATPADSLNDATWHPIPKPLNPSDELQLYIFRKAYMQLPWRTGTYTRKKMLWKVLAQATNFKDWDGYWAILDAIPGTFAASDEYDPSTWFAIPKPRNKSDEEMLAYYMDEYFLLPDATRDKMYWTINQ